MHTSRPVSEMIHVASYSVPEKPAVTAAIKPADPKPAPVKAANGKPAVKPDVSATVKPPKAAPATKLVKTATADPLAPLSSTTVKAKGDAPVASAGGTSPKRKLKDSDPH